MSRVATRILIGVAAAAVVAGVAAEWMIRDRLERRYQAALETRRQLELQLAELRADRDQLAQDISIEQARSSALALQLEAKDTELQRVMDRLAQEERTIRALHEKVLSTERQFDALQGELAAALEARSRQDGAVLRPQGDAEGMVQLERVFVTTASSAAGALQGRIVSVHPEWRFVVVDLGWDTIKIGDVVSIYRQDQLLGKARVERVQEQVSAATLLPDWNPNTIQVNDIVRVL